MAQKAIITDYPDGSRVISNIRKKKDIPVIGTNDTYSATRVTTWFDDSPMDDSKADGSVYLKHSESGEYYLVNLPNDGELFLEKDTVEDMRSMSSTEILLLRMGYYKGVTLNGHYEAGDTPSSIDYLLSTTSESDDGFSVFEVGGIKLTHDFDTYLHASYAGVIGDGIFDNTEIYDNIINSTKEGSIIDFYGGYSYKGEFDSNKAFDIRFNDSILINPKETGVIVRMAGTLDKSFSVLTSETKYGDTFINIPIQDAELLNVGDIIVLSDGKLRSGDNMPEINNEVFRVRAIDEGKVYIYGIVRSNQDVDPMRVWKVNTIKNPKISGFNVQCSNFNSGFPLQILCSENPVIENGETHRTQLMAISIRYSIDAKVDNISVYDGVNKTVGGSAYGVTGNTVKGYTVTNIRGTRMRHSIDFSACYECYVNNALFKEAFLDEVQLAHNTYGGCMTVSNIVQEGGIGVVAWADLAPNARSFIIRDVNVSNIRHTVSREWYDSTTDKRIRTVFFGGSVNNCIVKDVNFEFLGDIPELTDQHRVVRVYGIPNGLFSIENIQANTIGDMISFGGDVVTLPNLPDQGYFIAKNIVAKKVNNMFYLGGVSHVVVDGVFYKGEEGNIIQLTQLGGERHTKYLSISNIDVNNPNVSIFNKSALYNQNLLGGRSKNKLSESSNYFVDNAGFYLTESQITGASEVTLTNTTTSNLQLGVGWLPRPTFENQKITIKIKAPNFSSGTSAFSMSSAENIVIPDYTSFRLCKDKSYTFEAILDNNLLKWKGRNSDNVKTDGVNLLTSPFSLEGILSPGSIKSVMVDNQNYMIFNSGILSSSFAITKNQSDDNIRVLTFNGDGSLNNNIKLISSLDEATTSTPGLVKQAVAVPDGSSVDDLLAALRSAGTIAT